MITLIIPIKATTILIYTSINSYEPFFLYANHSFALALTI